MKNLSNEIKHMVNLGYWSCYLLEDGNYVLAVRKETYIIGPEGDILKSNCGYLGDFKVVKPINFPEVDSAVHPLFL